MCGCGEVGCVEAVAGGRALLRRFADDRASGRLTTDATPTEPIRPEQVDGWASAGDAYALGVWSEVADVVGHVVSGACTLLNPDVLILGGGVLDRAPVLWGLVRDRVAALTLSVSRGDLRVVRGGLGELAGPLGAGTNAMMALGSRALAER